MATNTPNLNLTEMTLGTTNWDTTMNDNLTKIDTAAGNSSATTTEVTNARQGASTLLANLQSKDNKIGNLTSLNTTAKDSLVNAVNEVDSQLAENADQINNLDNNKAEKTDVNNALALKANQSTLNATNATVASNYSTLDIKINSQASGAPKGTFSTLADLQADTSANTTDGKKSIYVVTEDGKWYYWNSSWIAGGTYQSSGIADKSITLKKIDDSIRSPFINSNSINETLAKTVKKLKLYNVNTDEIYFISNIGRNNNGWNINVSRKSDNKVVCQYYTPTAPTSVISYCVMNTVFDNIFGYCMIDWSQIPDTTSIISDFTGSQLDERTFSDLQDNFIFKFPYAVDRKILSAIKNVCLFNTNRSEKYYIKLIQRNVNGNWQINIADGATGVEICQFAKQDYTEPSGTDTCQLKSVNGSEVTGIVTIDWAQIRSDGQPSGNFIYNETGLSYQTYVEIRKGDLVADDYQKIDCDAGLIQFSGDVVIEGKYYTPTNKDNFNLPLVNGSQLIYYNKSTNELEIHHYDEIYLKNNLYFIGTIKQETGFIVLNAPYKVKKNGVWLTNLIEDKHLNYPITYGMPRYLKGDNFIPNVPQPLKNFFFSGRWIPKNINNVDYMAAIQDGQEIYTMVKGTTQVTLNAYDKTSGAPYANKTVLAVRIDNEDWVRYTVGLQNTPTTIQVATNLDTNEHYVRIIIANKTDTVFDDSEAFCFGGFTLDTNATISSIIPKNKVFLDIGDSITCGKNVQELNIAASEKNYIGVMMNKLNIRAVRNAFSGTGVIKTVFGKNAFDFLNNLMTGVIDNYDYRPDAITLNLGTNDTNSSSSDFIQGYTNYVKRINQKFPGVPIFCIVPFNQSFATEIMQVVQQNSKFCILVSTSGWNVTTVDGIHPDQAGSLIAGNNLSAFILNYFGKDYFLL